MNNDRNEKKHDNDAGSIAGGLAATQSAHQSTLQAAKTFAKPDTYTGNRTIYDDGAAKLNAKKQAFSSGQPVIDPYTGDTLVLTKKEAKLLYGEDWDKHLAESDHIKPLEQIYNDTKNDVWNTTQDIKKAANSDDNLAVTSRKFNNPKRSRTNEDYVNDDDYLKDKGVVLTDQGKNKAIQDGKKADASIKKQLKKTRIENIKKTGHAAGVKGARSTGISTLTVSGIMNLVAVIKGEKSSKEAIKDTTIDSTKAVASGYAMGGGLTVVSHTLSGSSSKFLQGLAKSNVPGTVITAVIVTGNSLKKWGNGEISTEDCVIELGEKGLNMVTMGYSAAVGQAIIPVPIVGAAVGALVGSLLTSSLYHNLINELNNSRYEHEERLRIIEECRAASEQTIKYRLELQSYLDNYFKDMRDCFNSALSSMKFAFEVGDAYGMISSANEITTKLGGKVAFASVEEFKELLDSDDADHI